MTDAARTRPVPVYVVDGTAFGSLLDAVRHQRTLTGVHPLRICFLAFAPAAPDAGA